jgi:ADP-ribose pyrophosphatase YjhB (NUDIX family)
VSPEPVPNEIHPAKTDPAEQVRRSAIALTALSQSGLFYAVNEYDTDRYQKLGALAAELLAAVTDDPAAHWQLELGRDAGYATPKVDVRGGLVDQQDRILLMRERSDGCWSLPGGWADPLDTPSRAVEREVLEETGYGARATKLVGCWDRDAQGHLPKLPFSIYKLFFLCEATGEVRPPDALETLDVGWFALDALPELSTGRVNARQLGRIVEHRRNPLLPTEFD